MDKEKQFNQEKAANGDSATGNLRRLVTQLGLAKARFLSGESEKTKTEEELSNRLLRLVDSVLDLAEAAIQAWESGKPDKAAEEELFSLSSRTYLELSQITQYFASSTTVSKNHRATKAS